MQLISTLFIASVLFLNSVLADPRTTPTGPHRRDIPPPTAAPIGDSVVATPLYVQDHPINTILLDSQSCYSLHESSGPSTCQGIPVDLLIALPLIFLVGFSVIIEVGNLNIRTTLRY
jgi:hypothetical protein